MKNRSLYAVLTRFGIIGAVLTAVLLIGSVASAQGVNSDAHEYAENTEITVPLGTYSAVDPEGEGVEYGVSDEDNFAISEDGVLTFKSSPDFEDTPSYMVNVTANEAVLVEVTITITNVQEDGSVELDQPQPEVGVLVMASVEDDDFGKDDENRPAVIMWQWARSSDMVTWEDIEDAESKGYTPVAADVGMYLRATASYDDPAPPADDDTTKDMNEGLVSTPEDTGISERTVRGSPSANARPLFPDENDPPGADPITINIDENRTGAIGDRVVAMDADNDVRLYSLTEASPRTVDVDGDANPRFEINERTGQISVADGTVLNADPDANIDNGNNVAFYEVTVTATDPSLATDTVTVTINVADLDEPPTGLDVMDSNGDGTNNQNPTELTIPENGREIDVPTGSDLTYTADDPDTAIPDTGVTLVWSLSGADAASFQIGEGDGTLRYHSETDEAEADYVAPPNHEAKAEYSITIEVKGGADSDVKATLDVTIKVDDVDEAGTVMLSARQPHVGNSVTAELDEMDDNPTSIQWRWGTVTAGSQLSACEVASVYEDDQQQTKAPSASYTLADADAGMLLCAQAMYFDDAEPAGDDPENATRDASYGISEAVIEMRPTSNSAPSFPDEDSDGTADPVMLEEAENDGGTVGEEPVTAEDTGNDPGDHTDLLLYSLEGPDAASFTVGERGDSVGQISVADGVTLDYENPTDVGGTAGDNVYVVMVKASDPSGASDMVEVSITVTNEQEPPMAPEGVTNPAEVDYPEGDNTDPVGTYAAIDPEGDDIEWAVSDETNFAISEDGVLTLKNAPDFEKTPSYSVDVMANDMKLLTVTVKITNVQEPGTVTLDQPQPQVGQAVVASVEDDDIVDASAVTVMWQWARSADMVTWEDIADAELEDYTPVIADLGMYLRATATYDDPAPPDDDDATEDMNEGLVSTAEDTGISEEPVEGSPAANAAPMFAPDVDPDDNADTDNNIYRIPIDENSTGEIGDAITATDADVDVRLYSLGPILDNAGQPDNNDDHMLFTVNARSGRISVGDDTTLDFETPGDQDTNNTYELDIIATDPSGATGRATVNIVVANVDEPPTDLDADENPTELTIDENTREIDVPTGSDLTYTADDPDTAIPDTGVTLVWSLSGADAASFQIGEGDGTLRYHSETDEAEADYVAPPNHEAKAEYSITIEVKGGADSDVKATLDVTIKVDDVAEAGTVMLSARQPHVGNSATAELDEMDENPTAIQWRWTTVTAAADCSDTTDFSDIEPSSSYTPKAGAGDAGDTGDFLCAQASYYDDAEPADADPPQGEETAARDTSIGVSEEAIEERPTSNSKPTFPDEDADGTADPVMIEEAENDGGTVGDEPVTAEDNGNDPDDHSDLLLYSLEGPDKDSFTVEERGANAGQISVADGVTLDYENPTDMGGTAGDNEYVVIVMAHDPSGASDMVEVTIKVTPVDEPPVLNSAPAFDAETAERSVDENSAAGTAVDDPVVATDGNTGDSLTYSLDAAGDMSFDIDDMGQITVGEGAMLDHETTASYTVTVTAMDTGRLTATIDVTITVGDENEAPTFDALQAELMAEVVELSVDENTEAGKNIGDPVAAMDEDADDTLTYSLDAAGDMSFDIDPVTGQLMTSAALDYESGTTSYSVTVTATDSDGLNDAIAVTIAVGDMNEAPVFASDMVMISVPENTAAGENIGDPIAATDEDEGATLEYSLGGDDAASFTIDAASGQLMTMAALDHETKSSYTVTVMVTDGELSAEITVMVTVGVDNVNEAPVFDEGDSAGRNVDENTEAGENIGDPVTATDEDAGDTLTYSLDEMGDMSFDIDPATGQLMTEAALDYESDTTSYDVTVTATDSGGLYAMIAVTIAVNDVPETPVFDEGDSADRNVDENTEAGENIGDPVTATGQDASDTLTYSLDEMGDMSFDIDSATGQLMTEAALDYESGTTSYDVTVTATDSGGLYAMIAVTIAVNDVPETPIFEREAAEFLVEENVPVGTVVGTETAIHAESYSDDSDYFDVDDMGNITTTMMLDYESGTTSYMVSVTATGVDGATDTIDVTVTVGDAHPGCTVAGNMGLTNDCEALLDAKGDLGGDLNWDTDTAMADWEGVTMSDGRVSEVWLKDEGLDGSVSAALGRLDMLTLLNLHTNSLSGEIPDLSGASMLEELYLPNNDLTGGIPAWLNGSTNLTNLWLWGNQLTGGIPDLSGLTNLDMLKLANNDLSGEINAAYLPQNVSWLIIDRNGFSGDIPDLSGLTSLELLWLHTNELTGSVPNGTMLPASLDDLNLRDNMLMGAIPDLSALDNLTRLRLHNNSLSGAVPGSLGGLDSLKQLWLHNEEDSELGNNMFTSIDDGVGGLSDTLIEIQLGGNPWADDACVPESLADVDTNDYEAAGIAVCGADDGS